MAKKYFRYIPDFDYVSRLSKAQNISDYIRVKNLFKRTKISEEIFSDLTFFTKYQIITDERPDNVAYKIYGDSNLDWMVLLSNNIINVQQEWPLEHQSYYNYLINKYGSDAALQNIHHYETKVIRDSRQNLIQPEGLYVKSNHSVTFTDRGSTYTKSEITSVSFLEHETNLNDEKRNIDILKPELLDIFLRDISNIMEYKDSSQFITEKLKVTENPRIISP